jgi:hypothetical protein
MGLWPGIPGIAIVPPSMMGGARETIQYLVRAWMDTPVTPNQNYANGQVLNADPGSAEGVVDGTGTVVEVDGTLAAAAGRLAFTAQGTPAWGDQGVWFQAITRTLGYVLFGTANFTTVSTCAILSWNDDADIDLVDFIHNFIVGGGGSLQAETWNGAGAVLENPVIATLVGNTDYDLAIVLGGYSVVAVPFFAGEDPANYTFGASFFGRGAGLGNGAEWVLLWRTALGGP